MCLSKYITIIGSKDTPWSEANRVIDRAEELFMTGSEIGVSSLVRTEINYYPHRQEGILYPTVKAPIFRAMRRLRLQP